MKFVNLNIAAFDAGKHAGTSLVADARAGLEALTEALASYHVDPEYTARIDGATGLLCEPGDPADLASKLERLLDEPDLRRRLGEAGRKRFEEHY